MAHDRGVTIDPVHTCPHCGLRFLQVTELRAHEEADHPEPVLLPEPPTPVGTMCVPLDPDRPAPVTLAVASKVAAQLGLRVELVAAPGLGLRTGTTAFLRARAREIRANGTEHVTWSVLETENAASAVLEHVTAGGIDLLCMATRSSHGPVRLLFGSVAGSVMARSTIPVLLIGPHVEPPPSGFRRVVACVDGSDQAIVGLQVADRLRTLLGADLHLVEVVHPDDVLTAGDSHESGLLHVAAASLTTRPESCDVLHGRRPDRAILDHLRGATDTIAVLGTHGRTGIRSVLLGSVARGVVAGAHGPVLVVPPPADASVVPLRQAGVREMRAPDDIHRFTKESTWERSSATRSTR